MGIIRNLAQDAQRHKDYETFASARAFNLDPYPGLLRQWRDDHTVQATLWDAPRGGHHVEGKLIFPALQKGKSILDGATKLTLTIVNVDAPSRVFEWQLK